MPARVVDGGSSSASNHRGHTWSCTVQSAVPGIGTLAQLAPGCDKHRKASWGVVVCAASGCWYGRQGCCQADTLCILWRIAGGLPPDRVIHLHVTVVGGVPGVEGRRTVKLHPPVRAIRICFFSTKGSMKTILTVSQGGPIKRKKGCRLGANRARGLLRLMPQRPVGQ